MSVPLVRTLVLYFAVICAVRLMGKRQLGEMDPAELVVTILVSDLAAVPMQDLGIPLFFGLVPIAALVTLEVLLSILSLKSRFFRRLLNGQPAIIIRKGQLDLSKLRQLRLTTEDLVVALRKQSVASVSDVKYGVIEPDGSLTIVLYPQPQPVTAEMLSLAKGYRTPARRHLGRTAGRALARPAAARPGRRCQPAQEQRAAPRGGLSDDA